LWAEACCWFAAADGRAGAVPHAACSSSGYRPTAELVRGAAALSNKRGRPTDDAPHRLVFYSSGGSTAE